ncbi:MAG: hypothetical protein K9G76_07485 [Bacteroidales bacterium]|nr:hypothetical protein [Bacteroidales bacterium]MCF8405914.1 hypothetical protein [Bacteroidales bacterium]
MKSIILLIFITTGVSLQAQYKVNSIGLRGGGLAGVSYKFLDDDHSAFELILGSQKDGARLTGLLEKYKPVATDRIQGLFVYTGFGAHSGYTRYKYHEEKMVDGIRYYSNYKKTSPIIGVDFIIGMEYHFESIPFHFSVDYKPHIDLFGEHFFRPDLWDFGFTIKYAFNS